MAIKIMQVGDKAGRISASVKNGESTASIPRGTPAILKLSTTASSQDDGLSIVLPATAGNAHSWALRFGVVADTILAGAQGDVILFGPCSYVLVQKATRAASSDSWTSSASIASGVRIDGVDTVNNCFLVGASSAGSLASRAGGLILLDSISSLPSSASATTDTRTVIIVAVRAFVRML